ncbi:9527_t:CDS:2, partial [Entrophospora sp. SA101]
KFTGVVTNGAGNVKIARQIINQKYPNILNLRCITHSINLMIKDIVDKPKNFKWEEVNELLRVRNFFADVEILCDILKPIKEAVISLQANNTNLRFDDFSDYEGYLLSYFLHPLYSGKRFENKEFKNITGIAGKFAKNFGYGFDSINELLFQIRKYKMNEIRYENMQYTPYDTSISFEDENDFLTDYDEYENTNSDDDDLNIELDDNVTTLKIEEIIDLNDSIFNIDQNNDNINENQEVSRNESTEYNVEELVSRFLTDYDN